MSITRAEISLGEDLAGLFGDAPRVLAMVWGFIGEDVVPQWLRDRGDSPMVELWQLEKDRRSPPRSQAPGDSFRASLC